MRGGLLWGIVRTIRVVWFPPAGYLDIRNGQPVGPTSRYDLWHCNRLRERGGDGFQSQSDQHAERATRTVMSGPTVDDYVVAQ